MAGLNLEARDKALWAVLLVLALALGWGPLAGCLLWLAWILAPILGALVANLVRNAALARKLAGKR